MLFWNISIPAIPARPGAIDRWRPSHKGRSNEAQTPRRVWKTPPKKGNLHDLVYVLEVSGLPAPSSTRLRRKPLQPQHLRNAWGCLVKRQISVLKAIKAERKPSS